MTDTTVDISPSRGLTPISAAQLRASIELAVDKDRVEGNSILVDLGTLMPIVELYILEEQVYISPCALEVWPRDMYVKAQELYDFLDKNAEDDTIADKPVLVDERPVVGVRIVDDTYIVLEVAS